MSFEGPDMINRDPNDINAHIQIAFEDLLAEPEGVRSIDCVWKMSYLCFNFWKGCCYKLMTLLCGCCIAMEWGCEFANLAFTHIWFVTPCMKMLEINCGFLQRCWGMCVRCCLGTICENCGLIFTAFRKS